MNPPEDLCDGNSNLENQDNKPISNLMPEEGINLDENIKSAIGEIRNSVKNLLSAPGGTDKLKKVFQQVAEEKNYKGDYMEPRSEQRRENTIRETVLDYSKKSMPLATREIQTNSLDQPSENLTSEESLSMSLVDSSMTLLHGAMKDLLSKESENPERRLLFDHHRVQTAVKCASEIGKLMKIKIDASRLLKG